ncbi:hypothetical protein EJ07DRAFT_181490 [Lizonia empirigonia]|nr:hypothetical protein EJ07DRAFT_181490 [Lizonia empirigonia]
MENNKQDNLARVGIHMRRIRFSKTQATRKINATSSLNADLVLALDLRTSSLFPELVSSHLPTTRPTFTFYHHPNTLIYFIFHSLDSATVQQRMKHTMAIPGLVNVHAQDCGVHVDQKIEIHEPSELMFEERDERLGKFRNQDKQFYDAVRSSKSSNVYEG